jgi:hypothetical protein
MVSVSGEKERRRSILIVILLLLLIAFLQLGGPNWLSNRIVNPKYDTILNGVCAHPYALTETDFQQMQALGLEYIRMDFRLLDFQKLPGLPFSYTEYDAFVSWSARYGVQIIAILDDVSTSIPYLSNNFASWVTSFSQFAYNITLHYKNSVRIFEVWNEPNIISFWNDPDATYENGTFVRGIGIQKYVTLLQAVYTQCKKANPNCIVISGGLAGCDDKYLTGAYADGAKGYFDILGLHPYFGNSPTLNFDVDYSSSSTIFWFPRISLMRNIMIANGDIQKNIMITEIGISNAAGPQGVTTEAMQADRLKKVFDRTLSIYTYVDGIMWYELKDDDSSGQAWGLFQANYTPRQMYSAYKQMIAS